MQNQSCGSESGIPTPLRDDPAPDATTAPTQTLTTPAAGQAMSQFVKFADRVVHRSKLKNAPYNPRVLDPDAKKKLKANLERVGLLQGPIWNERTGNIVGGHQRISIIDALEGSDDYILPVSVVNLDDATEKEQNVMLNNPETQGSFDLEKLDAMLKENLSAENMGFDPADIYKMFGDNAGVQKAEELLELADKVRASKELYNKIRQKTNGRDDVDYYVVVFASNEQRAMFMESLGLPDGRFVQGSELERKFMERPA